MIVRTTMDITREELVRILGPETVEKAVKLSEEEFEELKWERLSELLQAYDKLCHTSLFEGRRNFLLGLDTTMKILLVRHIFESIQVDEL